MSTIKEINATIAESNSFKFLAQSYSEVAASKLKRIRLGIEHNRNFLSEISTIYAMLKLTATQRQYKSIVAASPILNTATKILVRTGNFMPTFGKKKKEDNKAQQETKAQTTINVLLTSNYRFYGSLEQNLIRFFLSNSHRFKSRSVVVGRVGIAFLKAINFTAFNPVVFKTDMPTADELKSLSDKVASFDRVLVYHSSFQSVMSQIPYIRDIKEAQFEVSIPRKKIDYIFEPDIDKMLAFFDTQISTILLEQTFLESELARTAARLITMSNAEENANTFIKTQQRLFAQAKHSTYNINLLDSLSARFFKNKKGLI